ncbi:MAG: histidine kinase [Bacteroidetes bacterium]|jgi:two-component sensor histidine kinase|nr:histidine kinase [Bacteroidota bacterium]MBT3749852.1 histidine kinase [Bacteroidota bacterium]MBT4400483.1 histidine kinase [Bacteroidota bacterium]MBT4410494.1 histidine kinase [Bacteroidota bacterium]MBT5426195.1 histidine kinase [Bacteroidota bacterium]
MHRSSLFLLRLIIFFFISSSVTAQKSDLKYLFDKGQIIQYEHRFEVNDTTRGKVVQRQDIKILEFEVLKLGRNKYDMQLELTSSFEKTSFLEGFENKMDRFVTSFDSTANTLVNLADQGRKIRFEMDAWGKVLKIDGIQEFRDEVAMSIHKRKRNALKSRLSYGYITTRISEEYYTKLINDVFPNLHALNSGEPLKSYPWSISDLELVSNMKWTTPTGGNEKPFELITDFHLTRPKNPDSKESFLLDQDGQLFWDQQNHCVDSFNYDGIDRIKMFSEIWNINYWFNVPYYNIEPRKIRFTGKTSIHKIKNLSTVNKPALIIGDIRGCDSCKVVVKFPSSGLKSDIRVFDIDETGQSLSFSGDLPAGPDVITVYFPEDYKLYQSYESDPRQIRIFVRPGDTVKFSLDLRRFGQDIGFFGSTWQEQALLNSYILGYSNLHPNITLQELAQAQKRYEQEKNLYCAEFREWFELESQYEELEYRLNEIMGPNINSIDFNPADSLNSFYKYLNNFNGYKSASYKRFITRIVTAFTATNQGVGVGDYYFSYMLETVGAILKGWDKYYVLATLTDARMNLFYSSVAEKYYRYFITHYRGSEYGNYLEEKWQRYAKILPGQKVLNLSFKDVNNKVHQIEDFRGKVIHLGPFTKPPVFTNRFTQLQNDLVNVKEQELYTKLMEASRKAEDKLQEGLVSILFYTGEEAISQNILDSLKTQNRIYVTDQESVDRIVEHFAGRTDLRLDIDRDLQIAHYYRYPNNNITPTNLLSWPQMEQAPEPPKTINTRLFWAILTAVVFIAMFIFLVIRRRNIRREARQVLKRKMAELELDAVRSRMNPHFLFNALTSIQNLINHNEIDKANTYLAKFAKLIRRILEHSTQKRISLSEEIETLQTYLQLEGLRQVFTCRMNIDPKLDTDAIEIPPLMIQPHVENALIHGIAGLQNKGEIDISFTGDKENLIVQVSDNGIGLKKSRHLESNGLGQGWKLTRQRVDLLNQSFEGRIKVDIIENPNKQGTTVQFVLPME